MSTKTTGTSGTSNSTAGAADATQKHRPEGLPFHKPRWSKAYSFGLITALFFLVSWLGQFIFQMIAERNEASQHGQQFSWGEFFPQFLSSTFENWQSEFLQLLWQAAGLAILYFWGSSQSRESDERIEAKLDALLREHNLDPKNP
jgi:hypothetical protein